MKASDVCLLGALSLGTRPLISGPVSQITEGTLDTMPCLSAGFSSKNLNEDTPNWKVSGALLLL